MATVQSIADRVTFITKDVDRIRWTWDEFAAWVNDAQDQISQLHPRASTAFVNLALKQGSRQNLRTISPSTRWNRLYELVCNTVDGEPTGTTIRQVSRPILDAAYRAWRGKTPAATQVKEFVVDERTPFHFDVVPPVAEGTTVYALVSVKPARIAALTVARDGLATPSEQFGLPDGYDIPAVDYILFRFFSKDANDPTYVARAAAHLQNFNLAMQVETADAKAQ